jgi:hypothetical protein
MKRSVFEFSSHVTGHVWFWFSPKRLSCYMPGEMRDEIPTAKSKLEEEEAGAF